MATTNFVDGTVIEADWLNDVDAHVYESITAKAWGYVTNNGSAAALSNGSNIASVVRDAEGSVSVTFTNAPSVTTYAVNVTTRSGTSQVATIGNVLAGSFSVFTWDGAAGTANDNDFYVVVYW